MDGLARCPQWRNAEETERWPSWNEANSQSTMPPYLQSRAGGRLGPIHGLQATHSSHSGLGGGTCLRARALGPFMHLAAIAQDPCHRALQRLSKGLDCCSGSAYEAPRRLRCRGFANTLLQAWSEVSSRQEHLKIRPTGFEPGTV